MATKKAKKINPKDIVKKDIKDIIMKSLTEIGTIESGTDYGFTKDTLVVHTETCDIQIKLIAPKTGVVRYEKLEDEE